MEIHSFNFKGTLQFLQCLTIYDIVLHPLLWAVMLVVLNKQTKAAYRPEKKRRAYSICSLTLTLNGLISPGVEEQGMGQDL